MRPRFEEFIITGPHGGMRCNRCHRPMKGTTAYDGACACGGLIEIGVSQLHLGAFATETDRHVYQLVLDVPGVGDVWRCDYRVVEPSEVYGPARKGLLAIAEVNRVDVALFIAADTEEATRNAAFWRIKNRCGVGWSGS